MRQTTLYLCHNTTKFFNNWIPRSPFLPHQIECITSITIAANSNKSMQGYGPWEFITAMESESSAVQLISLLPNLQELVVICPTTEKGDWDSFTTRLAWPTRRQFKAIYRSIPGKGAGEERREYILEPNQESISFLNQLRGLTID